MQLLEKKYIPQVIILIASLIFIMPALVMGSFGGDLIFHLPWSQHFANQFWQGNLYLRWLTDMNIGCGAPIFFFYPPFAYYLTSLFYFLTDLYPQGWYPLAMAGFTAIFSGALFMYGWLFNTLESRIAALCTAIIYIFLPYTTITFYVSMNFSQFITLGIFPGLLFFAEKIIKGSKSSVAAYAILFAILLMTNIPSAILISAIPVLYVIFTLWQADSFQYLKRFIFSILLGLSMASIYILPMLTQLQNVRIGNFKDEMWGGRFHYSNNFLFSSDGMTNVNNIIISVTIFSLLLLAIRFFYTIKCDHNLNLPEIRSPLFWLVIMILAVFFTTPLSAPIWEIIPIIKIIQFPERISIVISLCFCVVFAYYVKFKCINKKGFDSYFYFSCLLMVLIFNFSLINSVKRDLTSPHIENHFLSSLHKYYSLDVSHPEHLEYLPIWANPSIMDISQIDNTAKICRKKAEFTIGNGRINVNKWRSRNISLQIITSQASVVEISQFYYPGWLATDEKGNLYKTYPSPTYGLIQLNVPTGEHVISLKLEKSVYEKIGTIVSLIAFIIATGILVKSYFMRRV